MTKWYVYIVQCADRSYYTGISTDVERRVNEHNQGKTGAAYTRGRRPVTLVYQERARSRAQAGRREYEIRRLDRREKQRLIHSLNVVPQ